jgi:threonine dehydrogenase-like Zn-dependent dehydrogenase
MKALTIIPGKAGTLKLRDVESPAPGGNHLLCEMVAVGICGTDIDISHGGYGEAPPNCEYLIIGHESLGRITKTPPHSKFSNGDLIVGIVRRPDPVPCPNCAVEEWDMCRNGLYEERGIKGRHGFASEQFRINQDYAVKVDSKLGILGVLLEPTSVVAKAWQQSFYIKSRSQVKPKKALITGAGPVGLLAALMGIQSGLEIDVFDQVKDGPKPEAVHSLGATYLNDLETLKKTENVYDIILECTGVSELILELMKNIKPDGVLCLAGISSGGRNYPLDVGALDKKIVLQNEVIFGSVNANRNHYTDAAKALSKADPAWLERLITRRIPLSQWSKAFDKQKTDIKTILIAD